MYLHALTNKMVPDTNSLSVEDLPEVATSQNNFEYCLDFNKFYQGRIDRSFCGDGPFCSLKQVLINAFSDSTNAMLVLDGYVMAVIQKSDFLYLFDSHARNSLGIPDENGTAVFLKFSELDEFQNHVETLGHCLNVETFEITSVHMHANVCAAFSEQSHINGEEKINELPVSGNKRKHAETKHCQTDEQKQATLAKRREAYQKKKACETEEQRHAKLAKQRENSKKRKALETDEQREAKLAKRRENYQKRKASVSDEQRQANHAKEIDNYRKRKASEPDEQRDAKLAKRRENYQKRKAFQETVPIQEQATCDSNECDSRSSTNLTDKNQYLREFDADKNGELHLQQWAKVNTSRFHKSLKYTTLQCTICKEAWPLKTTKRSRTNYVCLRCTRDKKCPKAFSRENSLTPSKVPPQLQGLTQTEEMLIARALPIMRVYIKPGGQRGYSGHCINLPQDIKELASSPPRYPKDIAFFFFFFFLTALLAFYSVTIVINEKLHVHNYEGKKKINLTR